MEQAIEQAIYDIPLEHTCDFCGAHLQGRADKKFCGASCRIKNEREHSKLLDHQEKLHALLGDNDSARHVLDVDFLTEAQSEIVRLACVINNILKRKATANPMKNMAIWSNYERMMKEYLVGWSHRFDGYQ